MSTVEKVKKEIRSVLLVTLYFAVWLGGLVSLKMLILAEYNIEFKGISMALVGALVLAKVVLVLEHVSLGAWLRKRPALVDILARTVLYAFGVFVVLAIEKSLEGRHDHGGFLASMIAEFQTVEGFHVWANAICITFALLVYNLLTALKKIFGLGTLIEALLRPLPDES